MRRLHRNRLRGPERRRHHHPDRLLVCAVLEGTVRAADVYATFVDPDVEPAREKLPEGEDSLIAAPFADTRREGPPRDDDAPLSWKSDQNSPRQEGSMADATSYEAFLERRAQLDTMAGFEPLWMPDFLFGFQQELTAWAIRMGRAALFEDCGMGKSCQQLVWAQNVHKHTGKPVLLLTPLAVGPQMEAEAAKFGIEAAVSRDGKVTAPVVIANYERLHYFSRDEFGGVVCDESSVLKAFDGVRRAAVTDFLRKMPYRLLATATAAPNDYTELGTSSEALGYLGHMDMLGRFFVNQDKSGSTTRGYMGESRQWRFKGHAEEPFWRWVSSWARAIRKPSDYGFPDDGFTLPPLEYRQHVVEPDMPSDDGALFDVPAIGLREEREELRRSLAGRCEKAAELLADANPGVAWCHLNTEGDLLEKIIPGAVQVSGADDPDVKEEKLTAFTRGEVRILVIKPKIGAWGLNWQHCHRMTYFAGHSFESHYQAVRRCWRFGQQHPVTVDLITTPGGSRVLDSLQRKSAQADRMFAALTAHMNDAMSVRRTAVYEQDTEVPPWVMS